MKVSRRAELNVPKCPRAVQAELQRHVSALPPAGAVARAAQLAAAGKAALHTTIHQSTRGTKQIAEYAGLSYSFLANSAISSSPNQLPFTRLPIVLEACDDLTLLQFLADRQGAVATRRPRARTRRSDVRETAAAMREFAAFIDAAATADAAGHTIHPSELAKLDTRGREVLESVAQLLADFRARVPRPLLEGV